MPEGTAAAIPRGLRRGAQRGVHPASFRLPLELPAVGRGIARLAASFIDAGSESVQLP